MISAIPTTTFRLSLNVSRFITNYSQIASILFLVLQKTVTGKHVPFFVSHSSYLSAKPLSKKSTKSY